MSRSLPLIGTVASAVFLRQAMRQKGWLGGLADSGLNAIPLVGTIKNAVELLTGDFIPDRRPKGASRW